jgi:hypothetical protein
MQSVFHLSAKELSSHADLRDVITPNSVNSGFQVVGQWKERSLTKRDGTDTRSVANRLGPDRIGG